MASNEEKNKKNEKKKTGKQEFILGIDSHLPLHMRRASAKPRNNYLLSSDEEIEKNIAENEARLKKALNGFDPTSYYKEANNNNKNNNK